MQHPSHVEPINVSVLDMTSESIDLIDARHISLIC